MDRKIDWSRCIHLDRAIDDELFKTLVPQILKLRQASNRPITIAINSPGGSVTLMRSIEALVTGPDQDGVTCPLITVAVHQAFSAAAMLLASGSYAVAQPRSEILFHDVRYGNVRDVTPTTALRAAESLQAGNEKASAEIANKMFARWMWMYLDIQNRIPELKRRYPQLATRFEVAITQMDLPKCDFVHLDLVGMLLYMHSHLREVNECIIDNAVSRMARFSVVAKHTELWPPYRLKGSRTVGSLDSLAKLFTVFNPGQPLLGSEKNEKELNHFLTVLAASLAGRSAKEAIDIATREMMLFDSMNRAQHWREAMRLMLEHKFTFFDYEVARQLDAGILPDPERAKVTEESKPIVRLIWLLCMQVARELFSGEHRLQPAEAMVLGLVDELPGGGPFVSVREFETKEDND